jgi:hypothetical protein
MPEMLPSMLTCWLRHMGQPVDWVPARSIMITNCDHELAVFAGAASVWLAGAMLAS